MVQLILECDKLDIIKALLKNIVISGEVANIKGFESALADRIHDVSFWR